MGGIMTGEDVVEFMLAGAKTVQVGTASLITPTAITNITEEFNCWCQENRVDDITQLVGALQI